MDLTWKCNFNLKSADEQSIAKKVIEDLIFLKGWYNGKEFFRNNSVNISLGSIKDMNNKDVYIHLIVDTRASMYDEEEDDNQLMYKVRTPFPFLPFENHVVGMKFIPSLKESIVGYGEDSLSIVVNEEPLDFEEVLKTREATKDSVDSLFNSLDELIDLIENEECQYVS